MHPESPIAQRASGHWTPHRIVLASRTKVVIPSPSPFRFWFLQNPYGIWKFLIYELIHPLSPANGMLASIGQEHYLSCSEWYHKAYGNIFIEWMNEWMNELLCPRQPRFKGYSGRGIQNKLCVELTLAWEIFLALAREMPGISPGTAMPYHTRSSGQKTLKGSRGSEGVWHPCWAQCAPSFPSTGFQAPREWSRPEALRVFSERCRLNWHLTDFIHSKKKKNWMEVLGHLSGTPHGAWFSQ